MIHILLVVKPYVVLMKAVEQIQSLLTQLTQQELIIIAYQALQKAQVVEVEETESLDISPKCAKQLAIAANEKIEAMINGNVEGIKGDDLKKWIHAKISGNH